MTLVCMSRDDAPVAIWLVLRFVCTLVCITLEVPTEYPLLAALSLCCSLPAGLSLLPSPVLSAHISVPQVDHGDIVTILAVQCAVEADATEEWAQIRHERKCGWLRKNYLEHVE
jgi:hypothetical protein